MNLAEMQAYESPTDRWAFLAPWTARLRDHDIRIKVEYAGDHTYRSTFHALELTLDDRLENESDMCELAEAVELVATALAQCPDGWATILVDQCECTNVVDLHGVVRLELDGAMYMTTDLERSACEWFLHTLMSDRSHRSRAFQDARSRIDLLAGSTQAIAAPIEIVLHLTPVRTFDLLTFVRVLKPYNRTAQATAWCVLRTIDVDWLELDTDMSIVERAQELVAEAPLVQVSCVTIHPLEVRCSAADFRAFFATLVRAYPRLEVEVGDVRRRAMRTNGEQLGSQSAFVMQTIAGAGISLQRLYLGQTSAHDRRTRDRRAVWDQLFGTLLDPHATTQIDHLEVSSNDLLVDSGDAQLIQAISTDNTGYHSPSSLTLSVPDAHPPSLCATIGAFASSLRYLNIIEINSNVSSETVGLILRWCPHLEHLYLTYVNLESMEVFTTPQGATPCRLVTLALTNLQLFDRSSVNHFLIELADSSSWLGRHLGEFRLARAGAPSSMWTKLVLDRTHVSLLCRALKANGGIHTVSVEVEDETPPWVMNDLMSEHRAPSAVQLAPLALECTLAWLSVTTHDSFKQTSARHALGHDVIRLVLAFAAECVPRWIHVGKSFD